MMKTRAPFPDKKFHTFCFSYDLNNFAITPAEIAQPMNHKSICKFNEK